MQGDSLSLIAAKKKIGLDMLLKLNPQFDPKVTRKVNPLQPGDVLKISVQKTSLDSEYPEMPLA
jgi:LysM repeat protein